MGTPSFRHHGCGVDLLGGYGGLFGFRLCGVAPPRNGGDHDDRRRKPDEGCNPPPVGDVVDNVPRRKRLGEVDGSPRPPGDEAGENGQKPCPPRRSGGRSEVLERLAVLLADLGQDVDVLALVSDLAIQDVYVTPCPVDLVEGSANGRAVVGAELVQLRFHLLDSCVAGHDGLLSPRGG